MNQMEEKLSQIEHEELPKEVLETSLSITYTKELSTILRQNTCGHFMLWEAA